MNRKSSSDRSHRPAVAEVFRRQIETQTAAGATAEDMTLRLTHGDASRLKRDPSVPLADIALRAGVMHFLDVKVVEGGVEKSTLEVQPR